MHGQSMMDVVFAINRNDALPPSAAKKVHEFGVLMNDLIENRSLPLAAFSEYLSGKPVSDLLTRATGTEEDENRWENIQEFSATSANLRMPIKKPACGVFADGKPDCPSGRKRSMTMI
jgi:hypothetical protein